MSQLPRPLFDQIDTMADDLSRLKPNQDYLIYVNHPGAEIDFSQAKGFLLHYKDNAATFNAYRRELERLLQWVWLIYKKDLTQLEPEDIDTYIQFCQKPPHSWISHKNTARFCQQLGLKQANPDWRPFVQSKPDDKTYQLSPAGLQALFSILSSFFNYLVEKKYMTQNPVALIRQKSKYLRKYQSKQQVRRLSELQWAYVIETAELLTKEDPDLHERTLFIMAALFSMYLRISELVADNRWQPTMGDFAVDQDGNWWFTTVGKGNKQRQISVSDRMLDALKRYRNHLGLSPSPSIAEQTPLINKIRGSGPVTSTRYIRMVVQTCFDRAISRLKQDGFSDDANALSAATVHWLRHTGISEDVKHRPREHVRDDAGHSSSAITDRYIDIEKRSRHASAKKKVLHPDE